MRKCYLELIINLSWEPQGLLVSKEPQRCFLYQEKVPSEHRQILLPCLPQPPASPNLSNMCRTNWLKRAADCIYDTLHLTWNGLRLFPHVGDDMWSETSLPCPELGMLLAPRPRSAFYYYLLVTINTLAGSKRRPRHVTMVLRASYSPLSYKF